MYKLNQFLSFCRDLFNVRTSHHSCKITMFVADKVKSDLKQMWCSKNKFTFLSRQQSIRHSTCTSSVCNQTANEFSNFPGFVFESKTHNETVFWTGAFRRCLWVQPSVGRLSPDCQLVLLSFIVSLVKCWSLEEWAAAACQRWPTPACLYRCFNDVCVCFLFVVNVCTVGFTHTRWWTICMRPCAECLFNLWLGLRLVMSKDRWVGVDLVVGYWWNLRIFVCFVYLCPFVYYLHFGDCLWNVFF